ncbi:MAG: hypothetical protein R2910_12970 [Gemmatimonadales bacterium]
MAQRPAALPWPDVDTVMFSLTQGSTRAEIGYWDVGGPQRRARLGTAILQDPDDDGVAGTFDTRVSAVAVDRDRVLLHLQSYEIMGEGSAAGAVGRDVFLVLSLATGRITRLDAGPALTHGRNRGAGCWTAWDTSYRVADVNGDGVRDLGVIRRELTCTPPDDEAVSPPTCRVHPVEWWVSSGNGGWTRQPAFDGMLPSDLLVLPSHLTVQPVDFVLALPGQAASLQHGCLRATPP